MGKAMKFIQPVLGAGELAGGALTGNPMLAMMGGSTLLGSAGSLFGKPQQPSQGQGQGLPSLSPTMSAGQGGMNDLSSLFNMFGSGGLSGSLTGSGAGGGGMGGGSTFGSLGGGGGLQDLLSAVLQGTAGGVI